MNGALAALPPEPVASLPAALPPGPLASLPAALPSAVLAPLLGLALGAGLLLVVSPRLWPRAAGEGAAPARGKLTDLLARAGLPGVRPGLVVAVSLVGTVAVSALVAALIPVLPLALAAGAVALVTPWRLLLARARRRAAAAAAVWPDVVDQLVSGVRSGLPLADAMATLATVGPEVTRSAFAEFASNVRRTGDFGWALDELKARLVDPVADRIAEAARLAREVGGTELTTLLRTLGATLRREAALRSEVEARQGWIANAARLGVAAPWIVLVVLASRPEAAEAYNSPTGVVLVVGGLALTVVAYRVMLLVGRIPTERRWFA